MSRALALADLKARLPAALPGVPISWPNEGFSPAEPPAPWVLVEVRGGASAPYELGGGVWQGDGQSWVHVLVPVNTGTATADHLVDQVAVALRASSQGAVTYLRIEDDPGGAGEEDGNYWRCTVTADWRLQTYIERT